jgi:mannose/fructose/N-acetylgalactosamine-specific phosphotransferase system component IIC
MVPSSLIIAALLAGLLAVERKAFLQVMASRPLVAGALLGLVLEHPLEGVSLGAALELFYLGGVSLGAALPDNELLTTAAAAACAATFTAKSLLPLPAILAVSVLVALPLAKLGKASDRLSERVNSWIAIRAEDEALRVRARMRYNLYGLWMPFGVAALGLVAGAFLGDRVLPGLLGWSGPSMARALSLAWLGFLVVATASALRAIRSLRAGLWAGLAAVVAAGAQLVRFYVV